MSKTATAKKAATSKAVFQTIEAIRACTADVLSRFQDTPLTRYEAGFQAGFEELGRVLHPAGYHRDRSRSELIAGLREPPTKTSTARLPTIEAFRQYLDDHFALSKKDPSDNRYLYGYEDANWFLWTYVDPMGFEAAQGYLPQ
jgi:hypothetical protein